VALITPLNNRGQVDVEGLRLLVNFHKQAGTNGLIVLGSAGESWTLSAGEKETVVKTVVEEANGKIPIVVGVTNFTIDETISTAKLMEEIGVDAVMASPPPYLIPTQEGIYRYFQRLCRSVDIHVMLYNVPYRTAVNVEAKTIVKLHEEEGLSAYKEAGKGPSQLIEVFELTQGKLPILVCDAPAYSLVIPAMAIGAHGIANITGNVVPGLMSKLARSWDNWEKIVEARRIYSKLLPLMRIMYSETNPVAVKAVMNLVGLPAGGVRPPLVDIEGEKRDKIAEELKASGLFDEIKKSLEKILSI